MHLHITKHLVISISASSLHHFLKTHYLIVLFSKSSFLFQEEVEIVAAIKLTGRNWYDSIANYIPIFLSFGSKIRFQCIVAFPHFTIIDLAFCCNDFFYFSQPQSLHGCIEIADVVSKSACYLSFQDLKHDVKAEKKDGMDFLALHRWLCKLSFLIIVDH